MKESDFCGAHGRPSATHHLHSKTTLDRFVRKAAARLSFVRSKISVWIARSEDLILLR